MLFRVLMLLRALATNLGQTTLRNGRKLLSLSECGDYLQRIISDLLLMDTNKVSSIYVIAKSAASLLLKGPFFLNLEHLSV